MLKDVEVKVSSLAENSKILDLLILCRKEVPTLNEWRSRVTIANRPFPWIDDSRHLVRCYLSLEILLAGDANGLGEIPWNRDKRPSR